MKERFSDYVFDETSPNWLLLYKQVSLWAEGILLFVYIVGSIILGVEVGDAGGFFVFLFAVAFSLLMVWLMHIVTMVILNFLTNVQSIRLKLCNKDASQDLPEF